jgi:squalene-hopene/tetraprenyl-beta-curcumene cyclase
MPVEIMALPRWFPFHLSKVSYWSRTVIVPLLVLMALKPRARNPKAVAISELFVTAPEQVRDWFSQANHTFWGRAFRVLDRVVRRLEPWFSIDRRRQAIEQAVAFVTERLNGEHGLGAIYPAMANTVMMFDCLGYAPDHPHLATAKQAIHKLVVTDAERSYCQPCLSPIWDTALASYAMIETGATESAERGAAWLAEQQVLDVAGDWSWRRPNVRPGGWPFQYANPHYPDLDDTAAVLMALDRIDHDRHRQAIDRGVEWILGMQSQNGGWGAFDADNTHHYLNNIPFSDHGALLDPPTSDVTARCVGALAQLGFKAGHPALARALAFFEREQEADGSWFGRWGTNYLYGTWSVLSALNALRLDHDSPMIRRAVDWLIAKQRADGGWGESGDSYYPGQPHGEGPTSTPSQTAWAVLGLMAAGKVDHPAVERGIAHLVRTQKPDGGWDERHYTAVGFPRVFYLRYDGYRAFFPLWAVARYRNLKSGNAGVVLHGM